MDNDIPDFLRIPQAERNQAWVDNPPKPYRAPALEQKKVSVTEADLKAEAEKRRALKTNARLTRMKAKSDHNTIPAQYRRWDTRTSRFVDSRVEDRRRQEAAASRLGVTLENDTMSKLTIAPFHGETEIARGRTSINADAQDFEIQAKVVKAALRAGLKKIERIDVVAEDGTIAESWSLDLATKTLHKTGTDVSMAVSTQETTDMPAKKKAKPKKVMNGGGVIATIIDTIKRDRGASADEIVAVLTKKFPDRKAKSMMNTVKIQAAKNAKKKTKDDKRGLVYHG